MSENFSSDIILQKKIDDLNNSAWEVRVNDSNAALILSKEATELSKSIYYIKGLAEGLRTWGFAYIRLSRHTEAEQILNESLNFFQSLNDLCGESDIYEYLGIIQRNFGNYKRSLESLFRSLQLRQQTNYEEGESLSYYHLGVTYRYLGNLERALEYFLQCLVIARKMNYATPESYSLNNIGSIYFELSDYTNALEYYDQSLLIRKRTNDKWGEAGCYDSIGYIYFKTGDHNKAKEFCKQSLFIADAVGDKKGEANAHFHLAEINFQTQNNNEASKHAKQSLVIREEIGDKKGQAEINLFLAELISPNTNKETTLNEKLSFLKTALDLAEKINALDLLYKTHYAFYKLFKQADRPKEALRHFELSSTIEKEFHSDALNQKILNLEISHQVENSKKEAEIYKLRNVELANFYETIKKQKENLEKTLAELKATQAQLIQSEKMASLGELTAGIAHEIQNPLNFVNNFSEVSNELIGEIQEERNKAQGTRDEKMQDEILNNIKQNLEKINHHGKRADAIVKGMLQHSRSSTGVKELTDINKLSDEYLRLSYHGLRAKDNSFNATMKTDLNNSIGKINIIPQDIGRVLLNLYNNAFYAVNEKQNAERLKQNAEYHPTISVQTKKINDKVILTVMDNGNGIPQKVIDKIFQPFFTTKPTGQGTGLGLSLSYDIIKTHGGEIKVETKEGEGTKFTIQLPINQD